MAVIDLGDVKPISLQIKDSPGALADGGVVTLVITLPDLTTVSPTVVHDSTGLYHVDYPTVQIGQHTATWTVTGANAGRHTEVFYAEVFRSIVSLDDIKEHLNITDTANDAELRGVIAEATVAFENECDLAFAPVTAQQTFSGNKLVDRIVLPRGTTAVTSVTQNGVALSPSTDYTFDATSWILLRRGGYFSLSWLSGDLNITVVYQAGSTIIPRDVRKAVLLLAQHFWETQRGGQVSVLGQGGETEWEPNAAFTMPRRVEEIAANYKSPSVW